MAEPTVQEDVVLDADARALFGAMDLIERRIKEIRGEVNLINEAAAKGAKTFDATLNQTAKNLSRAMSGLSTLVNANNAPGGQIQDLNANRALARQTLQATEYARELNTARNAAEALTAKIAKLNQVAAARGKDGGFATVATTDRIKRLEEAQRTLTQLDRQYAALETRMRAANGGRGGDFGPQVSSITAARQQLFDAASNPRRTNLTPELNLLTDAQAGLAERIALARREEASALRTSAVTRKELAVADASELRTAGALERARVQNAEKIRDLRAQLRTAGDGERRELLATLDVEKARGRQLAANTREIQAQERAESGLSTRTGKALAPLQMRTDAASLGAQTVYAGTQLEQKLALQKLSVAATDQERLAALRALDVANARVAAAERLVREENREVDAVQRAIEAQQRNRAANGNSLAGFSARAEIDSVGLARAQADAKARVLALQERINAAGDSATKVEREQLTLEERKLSIINQEVRAAEQLAAAEARQAQQAARAAEQEQRRSIGGRFATAARNTALYGGTAMVGFAAFNTIQDGIKYVIEMEDELAKLQAISASTDQQMQTLKASILGVGENSRFSVIDLIKISETLAQAGVSAGQMQNVLSSVTTLANASGSTPDEAVNLVTSALGAFQLQGSEAARVADLMTTALNRTKLTVAQTGQAIQYVGSTAFEQNISLEQLLATVGAIAQAGVKSGSTIGTGFRQFLVDLQTPSTKLTEQLQKLGLTQKDVDVSTRGLSAVLDTLSQAGFGSAQAYAGLETRAAAFYLTAKNNVDVMADLQMAFAQQGAAALANERAMDSLSAQWQRFKNIIGEGFAKSTEGDVSNFKSLLKSMSDGMVSFGNEMAHVQERWNTGWKGYLERNDGGVVGAALDYWRDKFWVIASGMDETANSSANLDTALSESSNKISDQSNKISELQKEHVRLMTQKDSLIGHDRQAAAEMTSLMSRFDGLAGHLTNTKNLYVDLTNAVSGFIAENQRALASDALVYKNHLVQANAGLRTERGGILHQVYNNPDFKRLSAAEQAQVRAVQTSNPGSPESVRAIGQVAGIASRFATAASGFGSLLTKLVENTRTAGINTSTYRAVEAQGNSADASSTGPGSYLDSKIDSIKANIERGDYKTAGREIGEADRFSHSFTVKPEHVKYIQGIWADLASFRKQITAALTPSKAETAATAKAGREAARAEREGIRAEAKVKQSDIDGLAKVIGLPLGSGTRTAEEQDSLFRRGLTKATSKTSGHVVGVARDFPTGRDVGAAEGRRLEEAARQYYAKQGITGLHIQYESGKGPRNGSGPHLHVNAARGASVRGARGGDDQGFAAEADLAQSQMQVDQQTFNQGLKTLKQSSSGALFDTAVDSTATALAQLEKSMTADALNDLAKQGVYNKSDPRYSVKMQQVADAIANNREQFSQAIGDGLAKAVDAQFKAATTAAALAMKPFDDNVAAASGAITGLGLYSNRFSPDYVLSLAQSRAAKAQEAQVRARAATLPSEIVTKQEQVDNFANSIDEQAAKGLLSGPALESATLKLEELRKAMADLRTEKAGLDAQLGASGLVPTTITGGIEQAIASYREAHNMSQSFKQDIIDNLGGAVDAVGTGLNDMFTSIITGTQGALGAFGSFAKGIMQYIQQLAAKIIATKILNLLFSLVGGAAGGGGGDFQMGGDAASMSTISVGRFNGGPVGYSKGGRVSNGSEQRDSVDAKLAKGEWVVNKKAVDSVGNDFMAQLNAHGAKAVQSTQIVPVIPPQANQETNVYVVKPDQQPQLGKNDVLVAIQEDILNGGETKKLIKHVSNGG